MLLASPSYGLAEPPGMTEAFEFATLAPGTRQIGPFQVTTAHMNHPVETFGYRLDHGGRSIAYSADTGESEALVGLARGADLLLCEASLLDGPDLERFSGELFRETINNLSAKELIPRRRLHHRHGTRNIDLATAAIIAHDRATEQKPFRSVYEDRGMLVLGGD